MVLAVLFAPFFAVRVQRAIDHARERRRAKMDIFRTLMSTRQQRLSPEHVKALNMIDLEFYGARSSAYTQRRSAGEKAVIDAWKEYLDHLNTGPGMQPPAEVATQWIARRDDLFVELLYAMSRVLGYDFDKVHLKRSSYSPVAHGQREVEEGTIRHGLAQVFGGTRAFPVMVYPVEVDPRAIAPTEPSAGAGEHGEEGAREASKEAE